MWRSLNLAVTSLHKNFHRLATDLRLYNKPADIQRVLYLLVAYLVAV
jgi:hypothetical protein